MNDRLFVLQVVVIHEHQWFKPETEIVERSEREFAIDEIIFNAADEEDAYETAKKMLDGFSDAHHDGRGDRTKVDGCGIHQLEEITSLKDFADKTRDLYGVHLPGFDPSDVDSCGVPTVRQKDDLEIFRLLRLRNGT